MGALTWSDSVPLGLAGAEVASHANCTVVGQCTLVAAVAWWWQCMAEGKGKGREGRGSGEMNVH